MRLLRAARRPRRFGRVLLPAALAPASACSDDATAPSSPPRLAPDRAGLPRLLVGRPVAAARGGGARLSREGRGGTDGVVVVQRSLRCHRRARTRHLSGPAGAQDRPSGPGERLRVPRLSGEDDLGDRRGGDVRRAALGVQSLRARAGSEPRSRSGRTVRGEPGLVLGGWIADMGSFFDVLGRFPDDYRLQPRTSLSRSPDQHQGHDPIRCSGARARFGMGVKDPLRNPGPAGREPA